MSDSAAMAAQARMLSRGLLPLVLLAAVVAAEWDVGEETLQRGGAGRLQVPAKGAFT